MSCCHDAQALDLIDAAAKIQELFDIKRALKAQLKGQAVTIAVKVCDNINGSQSHKFDFVVAFTVTKMQKVISSLWKLCGDWDPVAMVGAAAK